MYWVVFVALIAVTTALPQNWEKNYNRYKGYQVLEVIPTSQDQVKTLREWMFENTELDFWSEPSRKLDPVQIMAGQQQLSLLKVNLRKLGLAWTIYKDHLERDIDRFVENELKRQSSKSKKAIDLDEFNSYANIMTWLEEQVSVCQNNGSICTNSIAERLSVEGREIPIFTISSDGDGNKPVFFFDSTIHAREWLTPATILKIINHLVTGQGNELLNNIDFVIMPVFNPDGYEFSWTNERYWRKNRQTFDGSNCLGVDLNRNADHMWGTEGVSHDPCASTYCGPSGNSEPEVVAVQAEVEKYVNRINAGGAYINFHSYGYMWMHAWGNTVDNAGDVCQRADDHEELFEVATATADAIEAVHNTEWSRGNGCEVIYQTTGVSDDYMKAKLGVKYTFCPELRGRDFVINPDQIQPSFEEIWAGLVAKYNAINKRQHSEKH